MNRIQIYLKLHIQYIYIHSALSNIQDRRPSVIVNGLNNVSLTHTGIKKDMRYVIVTRPTKSRTD